MRLSSTKSNEDGTVQTRRCFPEIDESTTRFTFKSESGLLSATQFTQPALLLMEVAIMRHLEDLQLVPSNNLFAGHSLGEYAALMAIGGVISLEDTLQTVFYRGLIMQAAVDRTADGRSDFGMCAVDPSRVSPGEFIPV